MAITYGFFNSVNGDRTYDADQMSEYFDGLVSNGVYESVGGALQVKAGSGMEVNVQTGRGIINCKWLSNNSVLTLPITGSHVTLNRWTAIVLRLDIVNRLMTITTKDGTNASNPVKPNMQNDGTMVELCLAYVYVKAGATAITQANITDTRPSSLCGWVTGLVQQVDTSQLFLQWQTAYEDYYDEMTTEFNNWFSTLTEDLNVNTFIKQYTKRIVLGSGVSNIIPLNMSGYTYETGDIIHVYINGLFASPNVDYFLDTTSNPYSIHVNATASGTEVYIEILKSKIGFNTLVGSDGSTIVGSDNSEIDIS